MIEVQTLLTRCRDLGAELTPTPDGKLKVRAPTPLPEPLQAALKQRKAELLALLSQPSTNHRVRYKHAAETVKEDSFAIDPNWLIEQHPHLWEQMVEFDGTLSRLEQEGAAESVYRHTLTQLVNVVREARELYEKEHKQVAEVKQ